MKNKKDKVTDLIYSFDLIKQLSFFKGDSKKEKEFEEWLNKNVKIKYEKVKIKEKRGEK